MLFILSLVSLPLILWLRNGSERQVLSWLNDRFSSPVAVYLLALPIFLLSATLNPEPCRNLSAENGGWNKPSYLLFLLSGFLIASSPAMQVRTPMLDYANESVLPFYVMHQTILWVVGFYALDWAVPDLAKWAIILVSTFVTIMVLYEFLIRRINLLRVLFGMKPQAGAAPTKETALAG